MRARGFSPSNNLLKMRSLKINRLNVVAERLRLLIWHGLCLLNRSCTPCGRHRVLRTASQALIAAPTPLKYRANATIDYRGHADQTGQRYLDRQTRLPHRSRSGRRSGRGVRTLDGTWCDQAPMRSLLARPACHPGCRSTGQRKDTTVGHDKGQAVQAAARASSQSQTRVYSSWNVA